MKVQGQNYNFSKLFFLTDLNNVMIKQAKFSIIDQEKRDLNLDRGKNKVIEDQVQFLLFCTEVSSYVNNAML